MPYYSTEDDVTDFDAFDPTPYGGGYDQALTYGRPLAPSAEICYTSSSSDEDFEYQRPQYSAAEPFSAYGDDKLSSEYSSYSRPNQGSGRRRKPKGYERPDGDADDDHDRRKKYGDGDESDDDDDDGEKRKRRHNRRRGSQDDD